MHGIRHGADEGYIDWTQVGIDIGADEGSVYGILAGRHLGDITNVPLGISVGNFDGVIFGEDLGMIYGKLQGINLGVSEHYEIMCISEGTGDYTRLGPDGELLFTTLGDVDRSKPGGDEGSDLVS